MVNTSTSMLSGRYILFRLPMGERAPAYAQGLAARISRELGVQASYKEHTKMCEFLHPEIIDWGSMKWGSLNTYLSHLLPDYPGITVSVRDNSALTSR